MKMRIALMLLLATTAVAATPRIWRLCHTQNDYTGSYNQEAFAAISHDGRTIHWGANWNGTDNLEVYELQLPDQWWTSLPDPEPTPTPTPTLTPTPTPVPDYQAGDLVITTRDLNLRAEPDPSAALVGLIEMGTTGTLTAGPVESPPWTYYEWDALGWVVDYFDLVAPAPTPTPTPTPTPAATPTPTPTPTPIPIGRFRIRFSGVVQCDIEIDVP